LEITANAHPEHGFLAAHWVEETAEVDEPYRKV
jgi:hypothetical protein